MTRFALKALSFEAFEHRFIVMIAILDAVSNCSRSSQTILDRKKWNGTANPHCPQIKDEAVQNPKCLIFPSLVWGEEGVGGYKFPICLVQDCSEGAWHENSGCEG